MQMLIKDRKIMLVKEANLAYCNKGMTYVAVTTASAI